MPAAGVEPARPCERQILSLLCLPIPPSRQHEIIGIVFHLMGQSFFGCFLCVLSFQQEDKDRGFEKIVFGSDLDSKSFLKLY